MTEEQFNRAVQIHNRINALESVRKEIQDSKEHKLSYAYQNCNRDWNLCAAWSMRPIGDILDCHDKMIRQEIDEEIQKLKDEIKTI